MIVEICHVYIVLMIHCQPVRSLKLSRSLPKIPKRKQKLSITRENLQKQDGI